MRSAVSLALGLLLAGPLVGQTIQEVASGVVRLHPPLDDGSSFGRALAVRGTLAVVGSPNEPHRPGGATTYTGAVYLFRHDGAAWTLEARLAAWDDTTAFGQFGTAVDVSVVDGAETVAVGAPGEIAYDAPHKPGKVYLFRRTAEGWRPDTVLTGHGPRDWFGGSVSLDGPRLAVGQHRETDVFGSAYVFDRAGGAWGLTERVSGYGSTRSDRFGYHVSLAGDLLLVASRVAECCDPPRVLVFRWEGARWALDADVDDLVWVSRRVNTYDGWLSGNRLLVSTAGAPDNRLHPLVLVRTEAGWAVEADLFDPDLHFSNDYQRGNPYEGDHVVVAGTFIAGPPLEYRPPALYRRSTSGWRQLARLTLPDGSPSPYVSPVAVGSDGRFAIGRADGGGVQRSHRVYLFDLARVVAAETPEVPVAGGLRVYPSPTSTHVNVAFGADAPGEVRLILVDVNGREVTREVRDVSPGDHRLELDVLRLPSGPYFLRVETAQTVRTAPVLVIR